MTNPTFINPYTDFGFKRLFGTVASKPFLISFLNSILPDHHQIADLTFKNTEALGETIDDRKAIYDIFCESITGEQFIVELQRTKQAFFKDRTLYYSTFAITEQAKKGKDWHYQLKAVYCISILDFCFNDTNKQVIHKVQLKDQNNQIFYDKLTLIYFEMPKFDKGENELTTNLDKWLFYLKNLKDLQMIPQVFDGNEVFEQAFEQAKIANMNREEWMRYELSLKTYRDNMATQEYAKQVAWEDGLNQGIEQGMEKGIKKGILQTAQKLKNLGLPIQMIIQATGLDKNSIEKL
ncbi:hypothetical protein MOMA_05320 [Moraxella macacae 0408225]|uniref:Rpn family recombination-promoting nuclease/putative transposase n=1 Tax=Moraxella macacae 0408225 TaxID=1230338 RepID=L2FAK2_9GAMM|nr:Rpn family recombination-promoting nuclease/putative transposase [Moraxella macacae]ELA09796.1 hypothetical protein MOMA_05320 [Moraxella macacae 0408225]